MSIYLVFVLHWKGEKKRGKKREREREGEGGRKEEEEEVCIENSQAQETSPSLSSVVNLS
jgi:hypothetical protein